LPAQQPAGNAAGTDRAWQEASRPGPQAPGCLSGATHGRSPTRASNHTIGTSWSRPTGGDSTVIAALPSARSVAAWPVVRFAVRLCPRFGTAESGCSRHARRARIHAQAPDIHVCTPKWGMTQRFSTNQSNMAPGTGRIPSNPSNQPPSQPGENVTGAASRPAIALTMRLGRRSSGVETLPQSRVADRTVASILPTRL